MVNIVKCHIICRGHTCWVVQDFFHQQYVHDLISDLYFIHLLHLWTYLIICSILLLHRDFVWFCSCLLFLNLSFYLSLYYFYSPVHWCIFTYIYIHTYMHTCTTYVAMFDFAFARYVWNFVKTGTLCTLHKNGPPLAQEVPFVQWNHLIVVEVTVEFHWHVLPATTGLMWGFWLFFSDFFSFALIKCLNGCQSWCISNLGRSGAKSAWINSTSVPCLCLFTCWYILTLYIELRFIYVFTYVSGTLEYRCDSS